MLLPLHGGTSYLHLLYSVVGTDIVNITSFKYILLTVLVFQIPPEQLVVYTVPPTNQVFLFIGIACCCSHVCTMKILTAYFEKYQQMAYAASAMGSDLAAVSFGYLFKYVCVWMVCRE